MLPSMEVIRHNLACVQKISKALSPRHPSKLLTEGRMNDTMKTKSRLPKIVNSNSPFGPIIHYLLMSRNLFKDFTGPSVPF